MRGEDVTIAETIGLMRIAIPHTLTSSVVSLLCFMKTNWKTTLAGLIVAAAAFVTHVYPQYAPLVTVVMGVATSAGLLAASDAKPKPEPEPDRRGVPQSVDGETDGN